MLHRKVATELTPEFSSQRIFPPFFLFFLFFFFVTVSYEKMSVAELIVVFMSQYMSVKLVLCAFNLYSDVCCLFFNKTGEEKFF